MVTPNWLINPFRCQNGSSIVGSAHRPQQYEVQWRRDDAPRARVPFAFSSYELGGRGYAAEAFLRLSSRF